MSSELAAVTPPTRSEQKRLDASKQLARTVVQCAHSLVAISRASGKEATSESVLNCTVAVAPEFAIRLLITFAIRPTRLHTLLRIHTCVHCTATSLSCWVVCHERRTTPTKP